MAILSEMDDPEPDFGVRLAISRAGHLGSHEFQRPARVSLRGPFSAL